MQPIEGIICQGCSAEETLTSFFCGSINFTRAKRLSVVMEEQLQLWPSLL